MIKQTLNWLDLISTEKKTSQTVTIDKDDCAFSVVYSLLKIKSKAYIFENTFTIFKWQNDFAFHVGNRVCICRMPMWVRKTEEGVGSEYWASANSRS